MKNKVDNKIELIREKMKGDNTLRNESYARLLKRRRLEQRKTLEDVAHGVCSASYLCRIENAQVEIRDEFLTHLFEKLEINYNAVKELTDLNLLEQLVKLYYDEDNSKLDELINKAVENNIYSDLEIQLIKLFKLIVDNDYEEAKNLLKVIDKTLDKLIGIELIVYTFLSALLSYKINNLVTSFKLIRVLLNLKYENDALKKAIYDLALNVLSLLDEDVLFIETYHDYKNIKVVESNPNKEVTHEIEYSLVIGKNNLVKGIDLFNEVKEYIINDYLKEQFNYHYIKFLIFHKKYDEAFSLLNTIDKSKRMLPLLNYCINNCNDFLKSINYLKEIKYYKFNKYESFMLFYNELTILNLEKRNHLELIEFLKNNFIHRKNEAKEIKNSFIINNIYQIYRNCLFEIGKYKEVAKTVIEM